MAMPRPLVFRCPTVDQLQVHLAMEHICLAFLAFNREVIHRLANRRDPGPLRQTAPDRPVWAI